MKALCFVAYCVAGFFFGRSCHGFDATLVLGMVYGFTGYVAGMVMGR